MNKTLQGAQAETKVEAWFLNRGYFLIGRNYRGYRGEIDLILESPDRKTLHVVEVRSRTLEDRYRPETMISWRKHQRILKTLDAFLRNYRGPATGISIDLVTLVDAKLCHYPAFWG